MGIGTTWQGGPHITRGYVTQLSSSDHAAVLTHCLSAVVSPHLSADKPASSPGIGPIGHTGHSQDPRDTPPVLGHWIGTAAA